MTIKLTYDRPCDKPTVIVTKGKDEVTIHEAVNICKAVLKGMGYVKATVDEIFQKYGEDHEVLISNQKQNPSFRFEGGSQF